MTDVPADETGDVSYERLVAAMGDGLYAIDADGNLLDVNEAFTRLSGYDYETALARGPEHWFEPDVIERFEDAIGEMIDDGDAKTVSAPLHAADGRTVPVEVTMAPLLNEDGEYRGHVGIMRDVTERRRREVELEEYETIVRAMPDEVYTLDVDGHFTSVLPPTGSETTMAGYRPEELLGEHVSAVMDESDIAKGEVHIRDLLADPDREKVAFEMSINTKAGESIPVENHVALLPTEDGDGFRGTVGVLRDISARKAHEAALERQNERLEAFANVVSHDIRNPLNVATGHVELLRSEYDDERFDDLERAHERMAAIVEDVLALAREGDSVTDPEFVSLESVVDAAWANVDAGTAAPTVEGGPRVYADRDRLQRLLENLLHNAVEHAGPTVTVTVGPIDADGFYVADDGPGIPDEERARILESGYSGSGNGTGYGLAIVSRIAEAHGWSIDVAESADGGARFEFRGVETADESGPS